MLLALAAFVAPALAQQPPPPPPPPGAQIRRSVNLVVLPVSVVDKQGKFVGSLKAQNFRVYEDKVEQSLSVFKREDIPVTMGLVIDNSGSMRDKRPRVNEAALTMIQSSNPDDQVFVVNFNEDYYLDQPSDFTNNIAILKQAIDRIDSRGSTALYDAVLASLHHLRLGTREKKVLLIITDGEDNASRHDLEYTVEEAEKSNAMIYTIGLLSQDDRSEARHAKRALRALSEATGGLAFFPKTVDQVHQICLQVAQDIRNQYLLGYYPTNPQSTGGFRHVEVKLVDVPHALGKLYVRTRTGYYPQNAPTASGAAGH
ncbi:MAG TPA: VWA domain-containing protein [Candidatus Dormibacteraeota bacterium]|nr:VWA domain-containing protein [Candidatus Dormibacteraeota bacterium]